jgi:sirohydrochlorin cobaltochelatase
VGLGKEVTEFMMLEAMLSLSSGEPDPKKVHRLEKLDEILTSQPLKPDNRYQRGAVKLCRLLEEKIGTKVFLGYNEFCGPSLDKVFAAAAAEKPKKILVITSLSTPGNDHASNPEGDVLESVLNARKKYAPIDIVYAWPYRFEKLAGLMHKQLLTVATPDVLADKETQIILAAHGTPPLDMPKEPLKEYMMLHGGNRVRGSQQDKRHDELEEKVRNWPRKDNDAYWVSTHTLGKTLGKMVGSEIIVAFNEFCAPDFKKAFEKAVQEKAKRIFVVSPMWEPANRHSRVDVAQAVYRAKKKHPGIDIKYAWPYEYDKVVELLSEQLLDFKDKPGFTGH